LCVWRNQQLVGHVLALHVAVLSNRYHYNLQVCPQCPLRGTQGKSGGIELETSWNFIFMALANWAAPPGASVQQKLLSIDQINKIEYETMNKPYKKEKKI